MSNPKISKIVSLLHAKTLSGEIRWIQSAPEADRYQTVVGDLIVLLTSVDRDDLLTDYNVMIIDMSGNIIEQANDEELAPYLNKAFDKLDEIYKKAQRQASGIEDALDSLIKDLGGSL